MPSVVPLHWSAGLLFYISIGVLWRYPALLTAWLGIFTAAVYLKLWRKDLRAIFLVGIVLGTIGEIIFTATKIRMWYYHPEATIGGMAIPLWLPLLWGYTVTALTQLGELCRRKMPAVKFYENRIKVVFFILLGAYLVFLSLKIHLGILAAYALGLLVIQTWQANEKFVVIFLVAALVGPFGESAAIYLGIWRYLTPNFLFRISNTEMNIPYSLPLAWGLATIMIARLASKLSARAA